MESVCEAKIVSTSIYVICALCWFSIGFCMFFEIWRVLCSSYFGLFVASFFGLKCCRFLSDLGVILGALGAQNRSFSVSKFYGFGRVVPRAAQEQPKAAQERPREAQERPQSDQEWPWSAPRAAKSGPRAAKSGQEQPRAAPAVGLVVEHKISQVGGIGL